MLSVNSDFLYALVGGLIIGLAVTVMLLAKGRVTGISGITYSFLQFQKGDRGWRGAFLLGLLVGGVSLSVFYPISLSNTLEYSLARVALGGLLVGYGTLLGNGCTSGHGVCGISRFSLRSILATMTFITLGVLVVLLVGS